MPASKFPKLTPSEQVDFDGNKHQGYTFLRRAGEDYPDYMKVTMSELRRGDWPMQCHLDRAAVRAKEEAARAAEEAQFHRDPTEHGLEGTR